MKLTDIEVSLVDCMGTDLDVVNAARVSFGKESNVLSDKDERLISYLASHGHWSPFSHCYLKFRIKAPIFAVKQLDKSRVGLAINEVSRRYVDDVPEFWLPSSWRQRPVGGLKQGAADSSVDTTDEMSAVAKESVEKALSGYLSMLSAGVAPEEARMILPQNTMSELIWSGSLFAFARVVNLRTEKSAQKAATQEVGNSIAAYLRQRFPVSFHALCVEGKGL